MSKLPVEPDERLRAAAENIVNAVGSFEYKVQKILEFWDSAMREAAGLVCVYCRDPKWWMPAIKHPELEIWVHHAIGFTRITDCYSHEIHERLAQKEKS